MNTSKIRASNTSYFFSSPPSRHPYNETTLKSTQINTDTLVTAVHLISCCGKIYRVSVRLIQGFFFILYEITNKRCVFYEVIKIESGGDFWQINEHHLLFLGFFCFVFFILSLKSWPSLFLPQLHLVRIPCPVSPSALNLTLWFFFSFFFFLNKQRSCPRRVESVQLGCRSFTRSPLRWDRWLSQSHAAWC